MLFIFALAFNDKYLAMIFKNTKVITKSESVTKEQ